MSTDSSTPTVSPNETELKNLRKGFSSVTVTNIDDIQPIENILMKIQKSPDESPAATPPNFSELMKNNNIYYVENNGTDLVLGKTIKIIQDVYDMESPLFVVTKTPADPANPAGTMPGGRKSRRSRNQRKSRKSRKQRKSRKSRR